MRTMIITTVVCCVFILCSLAVQVNSQTCRGVSQYGRCSTNSACGCFYMPGTIDTGICAYRWKPCSELVPCESSNNECHQHGYICVHHPECHERPVCYPSSMTNQQICPLVTAMTNTTTITSTMTTNTSITTAISMNSTATTSMNSTATTSMNSTTATSMNSTTAIRSPLHLSAQAKWKQNGITVAGGNGYGNGLNQVSNPRGFDIDEDGTLYITDHDNTRIMEWKDGATSGQVVAGGNGLGNRTDQLRRPTDVIIDKETDSLIICDSGNRRVVRWPRRNGTSGETIMSDVGCYGLTMDDHRFLYISITEFNEVYPYRLGKPSGLTGTHAGANGKGNHLNQLSYPTYVSVDRDRSLYVSDYSNNRVMKWMKGAREGIVVAAGEGFPSDVTKLSSPRGVFVDSLGTVYVADFWNHRVMRWYKGVIQENAIVGGNGHGKEANQLYGPWDLLLDRHGNLYVGDSENNRVQRFDIDG